MFLEAFAQAIFPHNIFDWVSGSPSIEKMYGSLHHYHLNPLSWYETLTRTKIQWLFSIKLYNGILSTFRIFGFSDDKLCRPPGESDSK